MPRPVLTLPGTYQLIVQFGNVSNPAVSFRNVWDLQYPSSPATDDNDPMIAGIKAFHLANLHTKCFIQKIIFRNWTQGPQPFAARPFLWEAFPTPQEIGKKTSAPPNGYGSESTTAGVGVEVVLFAKRLAPGGFKSTNMFLRALLDNVDVYSDPGARWIFQPGTPVTSTTFQAIVAAHLNPYLNQPATQNQIVIVHVGNHYAGPAVASHMTGLSLVGVTTNKATRKNRR